VPRRDQVDPVAHLNPDAKYESGQCRGDQDSDGHPTRGVRGKSQLLLCRITKPTDISWVTATGAPSADFCVGSRRCLICSAIVCFDTSKRWCYIEVQGRSKSPSRRWTPARHSTTIDFGCPATNSLTTNQRCKALGWLVARLFIVGPSSLGCNALSCPGRESVGCCLALPGSPLGSSALGLCLTIDETGSLDGILYSHIVDPCAGSCSLIDLIGWCRNLHFCVRGVLVVYFDTTVVGTLYVSKPAFLPQKLESPPLTPSGPHSLLPRRDCFF